MTKSFKAWKHKNIIQRIHQDLNISFFCLSLHQNLDIALKISIVSFIKLSLFITTKKFMNALFKMLLLKFARKEFSTECRNANALIIQTSLLCLQSSFRWCKKDRRKAHSEVGNWGNKFFCLTYEHSRLKDFASFISIAESPEKHKKINFHLKNLISCDNSTAQFGALFTAHSSNAKMENFN